MKAPELKGSIFEMATAAWFPGESWVKTVTALDEGQQQGYMFVGEFLGDDAEIEIKPQLFLTMKAIGSNWAQEKFYYLVRMDAEGRLHHTGVITTGDRKGWADRLRSAVQRLLDQVEIEQKRATPVAENKELQIAMVHLHQRAERVRWVADMPGDAPHAQWTEEDAAAVSVLIEVLNAKR